MIIKLVGSDAKNLRDVMTATLLRFGSKWEKVKHLSLFQWQSMPVEQIIFDNNNIDSKDCPHILVTLSGIYLIKSYSQATQLKMTHSISMMIAGPGTDIGYVEAVGNIAEEVIIEQRTLCKKLLNQRMSVLKGKSRSNVANVVVINKPHPMISPVEFTLPRDKHVTKYICTDEFFNILT